MYNCLVSENEKLFNELYREFYRIFLGWAFAKTQNYETSADIVQDVFLKYWKRLQKKPLEKPEHYLRHMMKNAIIDHWRQRGRRKTYSLETITENNRAFEPVTEPNETEESQKYVQETISKSKTLTEREKYVLYLRFLEGLKDGDVAKITGLSVGSTSITCSRARAKLKTEFIYER